MRLVVLIIATILHLTLFDIVECQDAKPGGDAAVETLGEKKEEQQSATGDDGDREARTFFKTQQHNGYRSFYSLPSNNDGYNRNYQPRYGVWYPSSSPSFPSSSSSSSSFDPTNTDGGGGGNNIFQPQATGSTGYNLLQALGQVQSFKLLELISKAGLDDTLSGDRSYTIFAPTDEALAEFLDRQPTEIRTAFLNNAEAVKDFLLNHMVPGSIRSTDLVDGMKINSVAGNELDVVVTAEGVTVGGARLLAYDGRVDIPAGNGYVLKIDKVIYPYKASSNEALDDKTKMKRLLSNFDNDPQLMVTTDDGTIKGINLGSNHRAWLAIPYAKPPIGELRFAQPQQVDNWKNNGTKETRLQPNACPQTPDKTFGNFQGSSVWNPRTTTSEDCLYLNVHAPRNLTKSLLPVLVWIHGDGYNSGSASLDLYDPRQFVEQGGVVFVAIQYRLGVLGFLYLGKDTGAPGNVGLLDQVMALEWIQKNIAKFNGNPDDVTLMGEGSGASSAALHMVSPHSCRLFNKAILQSSGLRPRWGFVTPDAAMQRAEKLAADVGCDFFAGFLKDTVKCFRNKSAAALLPKENEFSNNNGDSDNLQLDLYPFVPTLDGDFLPATPDRLLSERAFSGNKSVLLGSNVNEGYLVLMHSLPDTFPNQELSVQEMKLTMKAFNKSVENVFSVYPKSIQRLIAHEYRVRSPHEDNAYFKVLDQMVGDSDYICNTEEFAQALSNNGNNVYRYNYGHRSSRDPWPSWSGVKHGDELEMTFGHPLSQPKRYSREEVAFARDLITYWTNFVKNGNPNPSPLLSTWPAYSSPKWQYLNLMARESVVYEQTLAERCGFWNEILPQFLQSTDNQDATTTTATNTATPSARSGRNGNNNNNNDLSYCK